MSDAIREIRAANTVVALPRPLRLGDMTVARREYAAVRVTTEDGLVGSAYCLTREAPMTALVDRLITPSLLGCDATDVPSAWAAAFRATAGVGRVGLVIRALGLVDIALWDIEARRAGMPLWRLLGGDQDPRDAMLVASYPTDGKTAAELTDEVLALTAGGWPLLKVARSPNPRLMRDLIADIHGGLADGQRLVVDAGFGWPTAEAALSELHIWDAPQLAWLEDPLVPEDAAGIARVRREGGQAVAAGDEVTDPRTNAALLEAAALDVLRLDVVAIGGITAALVECERAAVAGVPVSFHVYPEVSVHLSSRAIVETFDRSCPGGNAYDPAHVLVEGGPTFDAGHATPPRGPGLGFDLDWERFERGDGG
jgi:L-alanine-DL-glutamate epimerase-like enolase superfamily enzyme